MKHKDIDPFAFHESTFFDRYPSSIINDKSYTKYILDSMINIQAILAHHYFNKRDLGICDLDGYTIPLTNNFEKEIKMIATVFKQVIVYKRKVDGIPVLIQATNANDLAYEVFKEMIAEKMVDNCISHFYIKRKIKQDFLQKAFYEINKHESRIIENRYFDYLIYASSSPMMLGSMYIDVNGFSLDEIENDEYVQQFAARVKHLYLWIYKLERSEITYYAKELRWYL